MAFKMNGPSLYRKSGPPNMKDGSYKQGFEKGGAPKKAGPDTKQFDIDKMPRITSEDEEAAYEDAQNDYDTDNPTKAQLDKALAKVKAEKKR